MLVGPPGSGKTTLALAIAKAAAQAGKTGGATVVTAGDDWSANDTVGRPGDEEWERGTVVDAAARGRWLIVDELDRAPLDRALGGLSSFLAGVPVTLPDGENAPPDGLARRRDRRRGRPARRARARAPLRARARPAPAEAELHRAIDEAARGDAIAAAAVEAAARRARAGPVGAGAFLAAARFAAARNAAAPADERRSRARRSPRTSRRCWPSARRGGPPAPRRAGRLSRACSGARPRAPPSARRSRAPPRGSAGSRSTRGRCDTARVRILHVPWLFALPWFRRFAGYNMGHLILLARPLAQVSDDLMTHELCHVWQDQDHRARMWLSYLLPRLRANPHELEARRAVAETRSRRNARPARRAARARR